MGQLKKSISKHKCTILCILSMLFFAFLKQLLLYDFPIISNYRVVEDDALMVRIAKSILDGRWLGDYKYNTLMKGPMFPKILAIINELKLSYIFSMTALYTFSCAAFMIAIRKMVKNKYFFVGIFIILLFNPIMMSQDVIQRVYRNALIPSLVLFIVSSYVGMYLRRNDKIRYILPWAGIGGIFLSIFYYTREDSIWIVPFLIFMTICIISALIIKNKKISWNIMIKICVVMIPIVSLIFMKNYISIKNEKFYGIKTTNILSNSTFADAMKAIYAVKPNENIEYVSVPNEKVQRMIEVSPSLAYIYPELVKYMHGFGMIDRNPNDGEVDDGWFFWAFRTAVYDSGITTPDAEERIYSQISNELNNAMDEGNLERQPVMPSALMPPWRKGNGLKLLNAIGESVDYIASFKDIMINNKAISEYVPSDYSEVKLFEEITNNRAIYPMDSTDIDGNPIAELQTQDEYIKSTNLQTNIMNGIKKVYSVLGVVLAMFTIVFYIKLTVDMIKNLKKKQTVFVETWIVISGVLGALFTLIVGVSYNHISSCNSITYLYYAGAYPLFLAFSCICVYNGCVNIYNKIKKKNI